MTRQRVTVVVELLQEGIGQAREEAHQHAHDRILAFGVAGLDLGLVRIANVKYSNSSMTSQSSAFG